MLGIDQRLVGSHIQMHISFMHATKRAQERAERRSRSFTTIAIHFAYAIAVVIPRLLVLRVSDRRVVLFVSVVAAILLGVVARSRMVNVCPLGTASLPDAPGRSSKSCTPFGT